MATISDGQREYNSDSQKLSSIKGTWENTARVTNINGQKIEDQNDINWGDIDRGDKVHFRTDDGIRLTMNFKKEDKKEE